MTQETDETVHFPLREGTNEELAKELQGQLQAVREGVGALDRGLMNEHVDIEDGDIERIEDAAVALNALSNTLHVRAAEEG